MSEQAMAGYGPIMEAVQDKYGESVIVEFLGNEIQVRRFVPYDKFCAVVNGVADSCFDRESGEYHPENRAFATMLAVAAVYTNLEIPEDTDEQYKLLYGGGLYELISAYIDDGQYKDLCMAIKAKIEAINNANYALFRSEIDKALAAMQDMVESVDENMRKMLSGLDDGDIRRMVQAIGEHGIDEERLARSVVAEMNARREEKGPAPEGDSGNVIPFPAQDGNDGE